MLAGRQAHAAAKPKSRSREKRLPSDRVAPTHPANKDKDAGSWEATGDPTCRVGTDCCILARPTPRWRRTTTQFPQPEDTKFPHGVCTTHPDVVKPGLIISTGTEGPGAIA